MQLDVASATVIAASIGAIFGGGISALNTWFIRRSEERRQLRELAVRAAIEEWKSHAELAEKYRKNTHPLDLYLIHSMRFIQALDGSLKTNDDICKHLRTVQETTDIAGKEIDDYSKKDR